MRTDLLHVKLQVRRQDDGRRAQRRLGGRLRCRGICRECTKVRSLQCRGRADSGARTSDVRGKGRRVRDKCTHEVIEQLHGSLVEHGRGVERRCEVAYTLPAEEPLNDLRGSAVGGSRSVDWRARYVPLGASQPPLPRTAPPRVSAQPGARTVRRSSLQVRRKAEARLGLRWLHLPERAEIAVR